MTLYVEDERVGLNDIKRPLLCRHFVHLIKFQMVSGGFQNTNPCSKNADLSPLRTH